MTTPADTDPTPAAEPPAEPVAAAAPEPEAAVAVADIPPEPSTDVAPPADALEIALAGVDRADAAEDHVGIFAAAGAGAPRLARVQTPRCHVEILPARLRR